ncbi:MAG: hypothetical protein EA425_07310 [Puniceicoccaceae bacterium]|nr:MAG: hypothetical protein EA425_07310 [Puniceicoccaceae bacterium]
MERTQATETVVAVEGQAFAEARQLRIGAGGQDSNATQLILRTTAAVERREALLAEIWLRGVQAGGNPARVEMLFERAEDPWTKSVSQVLTTASDPRQWRRALVPLESAESYAPGEAMVALRLAFGPQTVEIGPVRLWSFGGRESMDDLSELAVRLSPLGLARVDLRPEVRRQTLRGMGGNFTRPRYGRTEAMDDVGRWNLERLQVVHARVGLPLDHWAPEPGVYRHEGPAKAGLEAIRLLAAKDLPLVVSVWEGPLWMLPGRREQGGRVLPEEHYDACIEAIAQYLLTARDDYGVEPEYVSFNEPDIGINFRFTPEAMGAFIRRAARRFSELGLETRWIAGDTANGRNLAAYVTPLFEDPEVEPLLGPISFHSWDALGVTDADYEAIAEVGRRFGREIWCLEAGHDAQLWQRPRPWGRWDNALRTAQAYARTVRLSGATLMSYWTYQDDYPLWDRDTGEPYPVFHVMEQMERVLRPGAMVAEALVEAGDLEAVFTVGPEAGRMALLLVNPLGEGAAAIHGWPPGAEVEVVLSAGAATLEKRPQTVAADGVLRVDLPPLSVVTVETRP